MFPGGDRVITNGFDQFLTTLVDFLRNHHLKKMKVSLDLIRLTLYSVIYDSIIYLVFIDISSKACYSRK